MATSGSLSTNTVSWSDGSGTYYRKYTYKWEFNTSNNLVSWHIVADGTGPYTRNYLTKGPISGTIAGNSITSSVSDGTHVYYGSGTTEAESTVASGSFTATTDVSGNASWTINFEGYIGYQSSSIKGDKVTMSGTSSATGGVPSIVKDASASAITGLTYNGSSQTGVTGSNVTWSGTTADTNAGSKTAYATPASGHAWSDGTTTQKEIPWSIAAANQTISASPTSCTLTLNSSTAPSKAITITGAKTNISASSSNTGAATVSVSGNTVTVTRAGNGNATITIYAVGTTNYNKSNDATVAVTCNTQTYSVTYNKGEATSGSAPAAQTKTYGKSLTLRTNTGGLAFNDTKDTTYTVTYNSLGGTAKSSSDAVRWKVWSVVGWANSQGGTKVYDLGATYTGNAALNLYPSWTAVYKTDEVTLPTGVTWADGSAAGFAINYNLDGGSGGPSSGTSSPRTIKYTFKGWSSTEAKAKAGNADAGTTKYTPTANTTLYAAYTSTTGESTYTIPTTTPTKTGNTFKGWAVTSGGAVKYAAGDTLSDVTASTTLYAVWQANTITVTFDKNGFGGTITGTNPVTGDYGTSKQAPTWARDGYTFNGWSTSSTSLAGTIAGGANFTLSTSRTYYVNASIITYNLTVNFGSGISKVTVINATSSTSTDITTSGTKVKVNHGDSITLHFTAATGYNAPADQMISSITKDTSTSTYTGTPKNLNIILSYKEAGTTKTVTYLTNMACGSKFSLPAANDKANEISTTKTVAFKFDPNDAAASGGNTQNCNVKTTQVYKVAKWQVGSNSYSPGASVTIPFTDDASITYTATYNTAPNTTTYDMVPTGDTVTCPNVIHSGGKFLEGWYDTATETASTRRVASAGATFTPVLANYPTEIAAGNVTFYAYWADKAPAGIYTLIADPDGSNRRWIPIHTW